jgi:hypothetical protein
MGLEGNTTNQCVKVSERQENMFDFLFPKNLLDQEIIHPLVF